MQGRQQRRRTETARRAPNLLACLPLCLSKILCTPSNIPSVCKFGVIMSLLHPSNIPSVCKFGLCTPSNIPSVCKFEIGNNG